MHIELTVDGAVLGTVRGLAHLADAMSRLRPGHAITLESDGAERFLADRIEALARRRRSERRSVQSRRHPSGDRW
jgi:hypothetical protein